jgi:hypothetical protein
MNATTTPLPATGRPPAPPGQARTAIAPGPDENNQDLRRALDALGQVLGRLAARLPREARAQALPRLERLGADLLALVDSARRDCLGT